MKKPGMWELSSEVTESGECMEAVIFIGLQATGKSSFYLKEFHQTHIRLNLDMLKTRHRERLLMAACLEAKQSFVMERRE